ncbi:MAG: hypothetical protein Q7U75_17650, partial [Desulfobacterales bacterium]|nr:hypothetical protein [Desulfobacterales bacterium]
LRAALRASDAGAVEADLRAGWATWRSRRQEQRDAANEPLHAARRHREHIRRAGDLSDRYWDEALSRRRGTSTG